MDIQTASTLATEMMTEHGLVAAGWTFEFDRATQRLGLCSYSRKVISMGLAYVVSAEQDSVEQTMLHEIAHALVGSEAKHGVVWQRRARAIGYTGKRTAENPAAAAEIERLLTIATAIEASRTVIGTGPLRMGDRVTASGRRLTGLVIKVNRTRVLVWNEINSTATNVPVTLLTRVGGPTPLKDVVGSLIGNAKTVTPAAVVTSFDFASPGDTVTSIDGRHTGELVSIGRTRYTVRGADTKMFTYPMHLMNVTARGTGPTPPAPVPYENIEEGDTIRSVDGRYGGVVVGMSSTRYHYTQADGRTATYPRSEMRLVSKGVKVPTGESIDFKPGDPAVLHAPGRRLHGTKVTIVSIGPKNIKVKSEDGQLISASPSLIRGV